MKGKFLVLVCAVVLMASGAVVWADEPPPYMPDPISLDRQSPSVVSFGETPANIYGEAMGGGVGGWDVGGPGPILHVIEWAYLPPMPPPVVDNNDGHSNGEMDPQHRVFVYFSGDDMSIGTPFTEYMHQSVRRQAAGDRFVTNGLTAFSPWAVMFGLGPNYIVGPVVPGGLGNWPINLLSANQTRYNEIPTIPPRNWNRYLPGPNETDQDDMDALELLAMDMDGDNIHDTPIWFSLDPSSPFLWGPDGVSGTFDDFSGADIFLAPPVGPAPPWPWAVAPMMGLTFADDIDALAVYTFDFALEQPIPGQDYVLFSLAPGSPYLAGPDGGWNTPDDFSAADIFVSDFSGPMNPLNPSLFLTWFDLGMDFYDNVDALDVEPPIFSDFPQVWDDVAGGWNPLQADVNGDGAVNIFDLLRLAAAWGSCIGDPNYDPWCDFNNDGCINIFDLLIMAGEWNMTA